MIKKSYVYANGEVLMQYNGNHTAGKYFYLHDRLGSVREIIDANASVVNHYTYDPFGQTVEESSTEPPATSNCFMFTGQYFDPETGQYYLHARQYDPVLMRFTTRDPERGELREPITLHKYLYCGNDSINRIDPSGQESIAETIVVQGILGAIQGVMSDGLDLKTAGYGFVTGAAAGGCSAWLSGAGLLAKVITNSLTSGAQIAAYDELVKGKIDIEKALAVTIAGGLLEPANIGFGQTAGKDFTKMLMRDYGLKWGKHYTYLLGEAIRTTEWSLWEWIFSDDE